MTLIFDIETGPLPDDVLTERFTFDESKVPGFGLLSQEFDPATVKTGNMKDPEKIKEKIEKAKEDFATKKRIAEIAVEEGKTDAWNKFVEKAALSPLTGQVLAAGFWDTTKPEQPLLTCVQEGFDEKALVESVLAMLDAALSGGQRLVGHNIIAFDIPFLIRRGLFYGIKPPITLTNQLNAYNPSNIIDTMRFWQFGNRSEATVSLNTLASFFGTTQKNGNGALFHKKFFGTETERSEAIQYLYNDIIMTVEIAEKLGVIR